MSINDLLSIEGEVIAADSADLRGIHGLQGGVAVALLLRRMRALAPAGRELVAITAQFLRRLDDTVAITAELMKDGAAVSVVNAAAFIDGRVATTANAVFTAPQESTTPVFAPAMPAGIAPLDEAEVYGIPAEFGPISRRMEVRRATPGLPYSGADQPILCGWVRLNDDLPSPDERLLVLADTFVASYTALLREPKIAPSVEMSVQLTAAALRTEFDWVLIRAETASADARGWLRENTDVWSADGVHLATSTQLRVVR